MQVLQFILAENDNFNLLEDEFFLKTHPSLHNSSGPTQPAIS